MGLDGGGSKTRCIIADLSGNLLARSTAGPSNPMTVGFEGAFKAIAEAIEEATSHCGVRKFRAACIGVAGIDRPSACEEIRGNISALDLTERLLVVPDAAAALAGATGDSFGVVVVAGTGSIAYGVNYDGETARAGGWGWMVGDEGSGYDIGRKALTAALRAYDKRSEETSLVEKLEAELGLGDLGELIDLLYVKGMKSHGVAALAPIVAQASEDGDMVAIRILREAGTELGRAAVAVICRLRLQGRFTVAQTGGVFELGEPIRAAFEETVCQEAPECTIAPARLEPAVGAVLLAMKELGVEVGEAFLRRIEAALCTIGR